MTPHLFRSRLFRGQWACCAKTLDDPSSGRAYKPLPEAEITFGRTPAEAYKEWMEYFGEGNTNDLGSA